MSILSNDIEDVQVMSKLVEKVMTVLQAPNDKIGDLRKYIQANLKELPERAACSASKAYIAINSQYWLNPHIRFMGPGMGAHVRRPCYNMADRGFNHKTFFSVSTGNARGPKHYFDDVPVDDGLIHNDKKFRERGWLVFELPLNEYDELLKMMNK
jgi:hypothetical protein